MNENKVVYNVENDDIPKIIATPPGPKSVELMRILEKYVPKAVYHYTPIFVAEANGAIIEDVDGNKYIDFASGISCVNIGHREPKVIEVIRGQLERYLHLCIHVTPYEPYARLAEKLATIAPGDVEKKVVLLNSGAEAVENAVKIARYYTRRAVIIAFEHAFHGRTTLTMNLTGSMHPSKSGFGPVDSAVHRTPYGYCYRCSFGLEYPSCDLRCVEYIRDTLEVDPTHDNVAAMVVEPIQGEGGIVTPPKEFLRGLKEICDENGILLIADEVHSGMGRTGRMFAIENYDVVPDITAVAKSLGGGLPLSAVIAKNYIMDAVHEGGLGGTFTGNPLSCVAGLKTIEITEQLLENAQKLGKLLMSRLEELQEKYEIVGDVRGMGLMAGIELVKDRNTKEPVAGKRTEILNDCHRNGLIIIGGGTYNNVIRLLPPINIGENLLNKGLDVLEKAIRANNRE